MFIAKRTVFAVLLFGTLGGCASSLKLAPAGEAVVTRLDDLPAPTRVDLTSAERPYYIGPFDKLSVNVFGVPELSATELVADAGGRLSLPLLGQIDAAGKTSGELAKFIEDALSARFVRNPRVAVNVVEAVSQTVTVDGAVRDPGLYPVTGKMTLMRAIATAKGTTEFAQQQSVVVFRTVGQTNYAALYNLKAIREGRYADPEIFPKDVVVVGDSQARRIFRDLLAVLPTVAVLGSAVLR